MPRTICFIYICCLCCMDDNRRTWIVEFRPIWIIHKKDDMDIYIYGIRTNENKDRNKKHKRDFVICKPEAWERFSYTGDQQQQKRTGTEYWKADSSLMEAWTLWYTSTRYTGYWRSTGPTAICRTTVQYLVHLRLLSEILQPGSILYTGSTMYTLLSSFWSTPVLLTLYKVLVLVPLCTGSTPTIIIWTCPNLRLQKCATGLQFGSSSSVCQ